MAIFGRPCFWPFYLTDGGFFLAKSTKTQRKKVKRARDVRAVGCVSLVRKSRVSAEKSGKAYLRKLSVQEESRENRDREAKK